MRLSRIKLAGFKSFVEPTSIGFRGNLSGVVGPNGCGKSNVIDAVRWVMGETSAKHLRGDSMEDVIFNGASGRKPVGQASVELQFDNSDGTVGGKYANYNEISVRRQVSRDGHSTYYLNSAKCRRRDITDIFLGTGLGPRSYAIIEQGMISRLVEAKPEELRVYLEEAAGISKYRERRRETENRIRATRDNLDRLNDLREEVARQIEHLQRQARAAERYKRYKTEERQLRGELLILRARELESVAARQRQLLQDKETALQGIVAQQRNWEAALERHRAELVAANEAFNEVQRGYFQVGGEISRVEQTIQHNKDTAERRTQELANIGRAAEDASHHIEQDRARLQELAESIDGDGPAYEQSLDSQKLSADRLAQARRSMAEWEDRWSDHAERENQVRETVKVQQSKIEQLQRHREQTAERYAQLQQQLSALTPVDVGDEIQGWEHKVQTAVLAAETRQSEVESITADVNILRERYEGTSQKLHAAQSQLQDLRGRRASLEALQQAALGEGEQSGAARWLAANNLQDNPRLAQRLQVDPGWELAVETALGEFLEAVCVDESHFAAEQLGELGGGRVGLLREEARSGVEPPMGSLAAHIKAPTDLYRVLHGIYVADDVQIATRLLRDLAPGESVITRNAEWLGHGWARVARPSEDDPGLLAREQQLRETIARQGALEEEVAALEAEQVGAGERLRQQESRRETLLQELAEAHQQSAACETRLHELRVAHGQYQADVQRLQRDSGETQTKLVADDQEIATTSEILADANEQLEQQLVSRNELSREKDQIRERLDDAEEQSRADIDAGHEITVRMESMRTARETTQSNLARMEQQLAHLQERHEVLKRELEDSESPQQELQQSLEQLLVRRIEVEKQLAEARSQVDSVESEQRNAETQRGQAEQDAQTARDDLQQDRMQLRELEVRAQGLQEQLDETGYKREELDQLITEDATVESCTTALESLERRINRLGAINLAAIDEHQERLQRQEYLDQQYADVTEALETLEEAIAKIDRETRTRFRATYESINNRLQEMFPRLFGGGNAYLEMTGDDLLTTGIAVLAKPPGKRVSNIHLLSGGEKALTAVALVFAFFELNPAPFCMLDEVDAPLDDANVGRYCELVREMSERVQFIFITHNKVTMEMSDNLIGVTMQEPGVSRLVAVDVQEAVRIANA